ncbi:TorF family putative porin [Sphingomonas gilva]|nr:TorF family putative porin [Sphingomonas gilva]
MRLSMISLAAMALASAAPVLAQDTGVPSPVTVTGGVTLTTDYRFRGLTQSDEDPAVQGTVTVAHESGFYIGTFASTIDGSGDTPALTGYGDVEIDFYGGYSKTLDNGLGFDVGLLYYYYADAVDGLNTDFFEPYAAVTYAIGPVSTKLGAAYAWGGQDGLNFTSSNDDNIYGYFDAGLSIPSTPVTLKGHVGYTNGSLGLVNPLITDDEYWDWSVGAEAVGGPLKVGVSYVDTNVTEAGSFAQTLGRGSTVLGYVGFSF